VELRRFVETEPRAERVALRPGGQRIVYGRSRPTVWVPVAGEWVVGEVLFKTLDPDGTWWAQVAYIHPLIYDSVRELLPVEALRPEE
jgi:hypothetical protein